MFSEIKELLEQQGDAFVQFRKANDNRLSTLEKEIRKLDGEVFDVVKKANRPPVAAGTLLDLDGTRVTPAGADTPETWVSTKSGEEIAVLERKHRLADVAGKSGDQPSIGRVLRGIVMAGKAHDADTLADERKSLGIAPDPSGGYTVQGGVAAQWIDSLRSHMVLTRAGALTVPMDSKSLTIARVTADPTCYWHGENAALQDSDPTFGAVELNAKTVTCLVKLSLELSQDSVNIEQILAATITNAMAGAIDRAGLLGETVNSAAAPTGIMNQAGNSVTSIGAPTSWDFLIDGMYELAADNVPLSDIGAFVAHPAVWKKMAKLKTGITSDNTPLPMPAEVAALPKLWTTAATLNGGTAAGIIGNWRDLLFGVRQEITLRVLSESYMGSNLQLAVLAYARCDFAPARLDSFCTLGGISV